MKSASERQLEILAVFTHGMLAGLHLLGVVHNIRKKNWLDTAAHSGGVAYDLYAVNKHLQQLGEK